MYDIIKHMGVYMSNQETGRIFYKLSDLVKLPIIRHRLKLNVSQRALGNAMGTSQISVCMFENKNTNCTLKTIAEFLYVLDLDIERIVFRDRSTGELVELPDYMKI